MNASPPPKAWLKSVVENGYSSVPSAKAPATTIGSGVDASDGRRCATKRRNATAAMMATGTTVKAFSTAICWVSVNRVGSSTLKTRPSSQSSGVASSERPSERGEYQCP